MGMKWNEQSSLQVQNDANFPLSIFWTFNEKLLKGHPDIIFWIHCDFFIIALLWIRDSVLVLIIIIVITLGNVL